MTANTIPAILDQAINLHRAGRLAEAQAIYLKILTEAPQHFDARHLLGVTFLQLNDAAAAAENITAAIAIREDPGALTNLALAQATLGEREAALATLDRALVLRPDNPEALNNRGNLLQELKRPTEALDSFDRALRLRPDYADALNNRGTTLRHLKRHTEALESTDRSLRVRPGDPQTLQNRALTLKELGRLDEAMRDLDQILAHRPDFAPAWSDRGTVQEALGRPAAAVADHDAAIARDPNYAPAHWNRSVVLLRSGDFAAGWQAYEWRFKQAWADQFRPFAQPQWRGEDIGGKTILLHADQGFGDAIQFVRFAKLVAARGARVLLEVRRPLIPLMRALAGVDTLLEHGQPLPPFDVQCSLMSLPLALGTRLDTIPADVPYLRSDPERSAAWAARLGPRTKPRVGIVWSGSAGHNSDMRRSLALEKFLAAMPPGVEIHTLQKDVRPADAATLAAHPEIFDHTAAQTSFGEAAALIDHLDLVISVDTSLAHLAGAMGKQTLILLAYVADWRWLDGRNDSPWYPTMRLFRQPAWGDWTTVLARVRGEIQRDLLSAD